MKNKLTEDEINDLIDNWHTMENCDQELYEFLQMTWEEYSKYVEKSKC